MNHRTFVVDADVLMREVGEEIVILNLRTEAYYGLNQQGARIWILLNESKSVQQILDTLLTEYDVERGTLAHDLQQLIDDLLEHGLIRAGA
ncbi:MAG: PqqD family protein [Anaerolineae bacterium]|nr:PqqD family protein [Anaerolineae bacterium]